MEGLSLDALESRKPKLSSAQRRCLIKMLLHANGVTQSEAGALGMPRVTLDALVRKNLAAWLGRRCWPTRAGIEEAFCESVAEMIRILRAEMNKS